MINSFLNIFLILSVPKIINMALVDFGDLILEENENYNSLNKQNLILESDKSNFTEIDSIGYDLIVQSFSISSFQEGKLVKITFLNSFHFKKELAHCICQLLKSNNSYYIVCIDGVFIRKVNEELKRHKNAKTYKISLMLDQPYVCDEMFQDITNQIVVFCSNSNSFQLSIINILNQTITTLTSSDFQFKNNCEIKFINELNAQYLLIYKCQNWMILEIKNSSYQILLNDNLLKIHRIDLEIDIVNQIQFCFSVSQKNIYLASRNWYYVFELNDENILLQSSHYYQVYQITLLIFENCKISAIVSEVEQQDIINFKIVSQEILIKKDYFQQCYSTTQYMILRHNNQLMTLLSSQFNQTQTINTSKIEIINVYSSEQFIISLPQLFYQIDQQTNKACFYELRKYNLMLRPQKKYIYIFNQYNYFSNTENTEVFRYTISFKNSQFYQSQKQIFLYNLYKKCSDHESFLIDKLQYSLPQLVEDYQIKKNENNLFIAIQDEELFYEKFDKLNFYSIKQIIWMGGFVESTFFNVVLLTFQNELICLDQNLKTFYKKNINQEEIFHINGHLAFVELNTDLIFMVFCSYFEKQSKIVHLNDQVAKVSQSVSYLILQLKNQQIAILDLYTSKLMYLNTNLLSFGMPIFYMQSNLQIIIQYQNLLIYQKKSLKFLMFPFENATILEVEIQLSQIKIKTIHFELNFLKTFYLNDDQINEVDQYYLQNFRLSNQKQMIFSSKILILAGYQFDEKVLYILHFDNYIKILNIKFTNQFQFSYFNGNLFYYNPKNQLMVFDVRNLNVTVNNLIKQNNYFDEYQLAFSMLYNQNQNLFTITREIKIIYFNQCYKIFPIKNSIYSNETQKISLREIFIGPIDQITLDNQNFSSIQIPLNFKHTFQICTSQNDNQCIQTKIFLKLDYLNFNCLLDENQKLTYCESQTIDIFYKLIKQFISYEDQVIINLIKYNNKYYFQRFKLDNTSQQIGELFQSDLKIFNIDLDSVSFFQIDFKNQKNLILISFLSTDSLKRSQFFFFENETVLHHSSDDYFTNLCFIKNTSEWYLIQQNYKFENKQKIYQFQIITNENMKINLIFQFKIDNQIMKFFIENNLIEVNQLWNDFQQLFIELQECEKNQNEIKFITFSSFPQFSCVIEITFNIINQQIDFQILKVIRNPSHFSRFFIVNFDTSFLLIYELEKKYYYYYDLSDYQPMYDYIYRTTQLDIQFFRINTTHYIFKQINLERYHIGTIGYYFHEQMQMVESFITASNQVSSSQIRIVHLKHGDRFKYKFLIFGILVLCGFYLFRRWRLQQVQQKNQMIIKN